MLENWQFSKLGFSFIIWSLLLALAILHKRECFWNVVCVFKVFPRVLNEWIMWGRIWHGFYHLTLKTIPGTDSFHLRLTNEEAKLERGYVISPTSRRDRTHVVTWFQSSPLITAFYSLSWSSVLKKKGGGGKRLFHPSRVAILTSQNRLMTLKCFKCSLVWDSSENALTSWRWPSEYQGQPRTLYLVSGGKVPPKQVRFHGNNAESAWRRLTGHQSCPSRTDSESLRFPTTVPLKEHGCAARIFKAGDTWLCRQGHRPQFPEIIK